MPCWNSFLVASCLLLAVRGQDDAPLPSRQGEAAVEEREARPASARALFERFAKMKGLEVAFQEKKHLALLALPLESRGKIYFMRPGYLSRVVEAPTESKLTITPEELRLDNKHEQKVIDLRQNAELRTFVTSLLHVFAGQRELLEKSYAIQYTLDSEDEFGWTLTLTPREKPLTEMLRSLRMVGSGVAVTRIEMHEPNGDKTVTTVLTHDAKRQFSADEQLLFFDIPKTPEKQSKEKAL